MNTTSEVPGSSRPPSYVLLVFSQALAFFIIVGNSLLLCYFEDIYLGHVNESCVQNLDINSMACSRDHGRTLANANIDNA